MQRAVRYSDDGGKNWGSPVAIGSSLTSRQKSIGSFATLDSAKQLVQVGVQARNTSGSRVEKALLVAYVHLKH